MTMDSSPSKRLLLLIDGLNFVRRVYEANPAPDSADKAEGALRNSTASIRRAITDSQPTHLLLAFDAGGLTFRHGLYPGYKEYRTPMPAPLSAALPEFLDRLRAKGYPVVVSPGVEAEDVIATAAVKAAGLGSDIIIKSTDKDVLPLLALTGVRVHDHFKRGPDDGVHASGEWRDAAWCVAKFGVTPEKMTDLLAMMGDRVDGIPGIARVGVKTAAALLNEHGSLEAVLSAAADMKGSLGKRLREHAEIARLSRELVQLRTDVDLEIRTWAELKAPVFD